MKVAVALALLLGAACKPAATPTDAPATPPLTKVELERGRALCTHYVARVCACADADATLRATCDLARAQPEALELQAQLLDGANGALNPRERSITEANLRKVVAACVADDGKLDPRTCPRR